MRFLVDAQLPPALARWLEAQGYEAAHVADIGMTSATDHSIWQRAVETDSVIVTKDEDFALWRSASNDSLPLIVWLRIGNTRKAALFEWFAPLLPQITRALEQGERLIEVN